MTVETTVPLSSLAVGQTFVWGTEGFVILDPTPLPPPDAGKRWFFRLNSAMIDQAVDTMLVTPVPLKVVYG